MPYKRAVEYLESKIKTVPKAAVVLGTGLGDIVEKVSDPIIIPYDDIPGFPSVKNSFHECRAVIGNFMGTNIIFMQGRIHYYEGYSMEEVVFPVRMLRQLGIEYLILTNASGAVNEGYTPGDIVLIRDHIKLGFDSPVRGKNNDELGDRFFDMSNAYDPDMRLVAVKAAKEIGIELNSGVYAYMTGPQFETPAEIRMLRIMGADLVGMSTVPEVIAGVHCGMRILGLSGVTNMAAGIENGGHNKIVIANSEEILRDKLADLLSGIISRINSL